MNNKKDIEIDRNDLENALIISYSHSGNTHQIAKMIQLLTLAIDAVGLVLAIIDKRKTDR